MAAILYKAADECGFVDPQKVEEILGVSKEKAETSGMTVGEETRWLSNKQIVCLAASISQPDIETIALGYLNISADVIYVLRKDNRSDPEKFNRDVLRHWANMNAGSDQVMVGLLRTFILFIFVACAR